MRLAPPKSKKPFASSLFYPPLSIRCIWYLQDHCDAILVISGLLGACFNAFGSVWGFVIWLPGNIGLAILNHKRGLKWQAALFAAYALTAAWGIYRGFHA
jgi:hypothetical protein